MMLLKIDHMFYKIKKIGKIVTRYFGVPHLIAAHYKSVILICGIAYIVGGVACFAQVYVTCQKVLKSVPLILLIAVTGKVFYKLFG